MPGTDAPQSRPGSGPHPGIRFAEIRAACQRVGLDVVAALHPVTEHGAPASCRTLVLLGPDGNRFWRILQDSPEFDHADPVDRWSQRVVTALAHNLGATPLFPFGGPPHRPFVRWALASGQIWNSPVGLLVHAKAGLWVSFRGALAFEDTFDIPPGGAHAPCLDCSERPCLAACPPAALSGAGYDIEACHAWLDRDAGKECMARGCAVRRACPAGREYGRLDQQSAHHMRHFHER